MIAIVDYGLGNLGSIANMLKVVGEKTKITRDKADIQLAEGIILPGVGAFDAGMSRLNELALSDVIVTEAKKGKPVLGICLGMQLLGRRSEEGNLSGLSLLPLECKKFKFENTSLKIPHMGWDIVDLKMSHPIVAGLEEPQRYYFVHSYYAVCEKKNVLMTCDYGEEFPAAVVSNNIIGVQFHPEKSHDFGMALLSNFAQICNAYKNSGIGEK